MKVSFLGLGVMGYPMAGHLAKAGHNVTVFNRSPQKAQKWAEEHQGTIASDIAEAVSKAQVVLACVGNDQDSLEVARTAVAAMPDEALYIDHTTTSAHCAEQIEAQAETQKIAFVDAPVSGGEAGAVNGALSVMCGGRVPDLARAEKIMTAYSKRIVHVGPVGHGQLCKSVNQIAIASLLQGLSEAVHFCKRSGIDSDKVLEAVSGGAAQSWQMENRWKTMVKGEFDFGFAVDWMRKDLAIAFNEADRFDADLTMTKLVDARYQQIQQQGHNRWDTSSLISLLED
ncbi:MAG: NAD(P)-dependent oxidoreductase [bacterium]